MRVRLLNKPKPNNYTEAFMVNMAGIRGKECASTQGGLVDVASAILGDLNKAYKKVKSNKGKGGIDGMQVDELLSYLRKKQSEIIRKIRDGKYRPNPVRRVEIGTAV